MSTTVNPDDLRFSYHPFDEAIRSRQAVTGGEVLEIVVSGYMQATWESPRGAYSFGWTTDHDSTEVYENEPELREIVARRLAESYDQAVRDA